MNVEKCCLDCKYLSWHSSSGVSYERCSYESEKGVPAVLTAELRASQPTTAEFPAPSTAMALTAALAAGYP